MRDNKGKQAFIVAMVAALSFALFVAGGVWILLDRNPGEAETPAAISGSEAEDQGEGLALSPVDSSSDPDEPVAGTELGQIQVHAEPEYNPCGVLMAPA